MSAEKINSTYEPPPPYTTNPPPQGPNYTTPGPYGGNVGKEIVTFLCIICSISHVYYC